MRDELQHKTMPPTRTRRDVLHRLGVALSVMPLLGIAGCNDPITSGSGGDGGAGGPGGPAGLVSQ